MNSTLTIKISETGKNPYNTLLLEGGDGCWMVIKHKPGQIKIVKLGWAWRAYLFVTRMFNKAKKSDQ